ncbi:MAG: S41 family peptidase [Prevotella sp.]
MRISTLPSRFIFFLCTLLCISCIDEEEMPNTPKGNFDALWKILDEHYCFFDYKKEVYGLDWNEIYATYAPRVNEKMNSTQLFEVCSDMLSQLRDGHVNLSTSYDFARYWSWYEDYPANFSELLWRQYMGTDYKIASSLKYKVLPNNVGYIYYESFTSSFGEGNLDEVLASFMLCRGLIIDVRNNSGGMLTNAEKLAARFVNEPTLVGYMQHKTGKGHQDFSSMEEQWLQPSENVRWHKRVCVLTNRKVYSAANEFVKYMKALPQTIIVGDQTGGGAGMPFCNSLPNGWAVRFSACPMYDKDKNSTEFGIAPHYKVDITEKDYLENNDAILEFAAKLFEN